MKPAKILKVFIFISIAISLVLTIAVSLFIAFYPAEKILKLVTEQAERSLGRKVTVGGISYGFGGIALDNVVLYENEREVSSILASVDRADLTVSLLSLLKMELNFDSISLKNARCNIVFNKNGESNIGALISDLSKKGGSGVSAKIRKIKLSNAVLTLSNPPPYLVPLAGTYTFQGTIYIDATIMIRDCSVILPQARGTLYPELAIKTSGNDFEITGAVKLENAALPWVYRWGTNVTLPYNIVNGTVTNLIITKNFVKGEAKATSTLINSATLVKADGFCHVDIAGRTVFIGRTQGGIDASSFYIDNLHFTFEGKLIRFSIRNINASIGNVKPLLQFIPAKLFGTVEGNLECSNGMYNGTLSISNCGYDADLKIISDLRTDLSIANNLFKKTDIPFKLYGNPCTLSIASTESSMSRLFINLNADRIELDSIKDRFSQSDEPIDIPLEIVGNISVNQLRFGPHRLSAIQILYQISGTSLVIKGFQFFFADGKISGNGVIRNEQGPPKASLSLAINNCVVQNAIAFNEKWRNRFFGVINGNSKIDFGLNSGILQTARGNVEFTIDRGKLVDTGIQNGLGLLLAELKYKLRDMEFNKIYGNIDIRGTTYILNSFIFNSDVVRLKITGAFDQNLTANPLNIGLEFTKEFIQDLPGAIRLGLNKYQRGEWYVIPFIMSGDMTNSKNVKRVN
ncbi:MAG: hypothetical protein A2176_08150 [Spirochaetes bacterium RBG_13_51_14]|nr:MAG: hypothetical protein A2176_08150 [Spirochaetes bacterium RBG_13_51_14]